jgi:hypothetical protein
MVFTADEIETFVKELSELKLTTNVDEINKMEKFNEFKNQNKLFYEMILSKEGLDTLIFKEMMKMKRRLESGEEQYDVDVRFGQFMANRFIDPVITNKK